MVLKHLYQGSLKTRLTLAILGIFLLGMWSLMSYASHTLQQDMQELLEAQQRSTLSLLAAEVDQQLSERLEGLKKAANGISPAVLGHAASVQALLGQRPVLDTLFNGGLVVYRSDGTAVAEVPLTAGRVGLNFMDVDTVAAALLEGQATIGQPVLCPQLNAPVIVMAAPIRDAQGRVVGALAGVTNLAVPNFLDQLTGNRYGKSGDFVLIAPQHGLVVTSSDRSRVMTALPPLGLSPMIDRYRQGYNGSDIFVDPFGVEVLVVSQRVPTADWYLNVRLPTAEAFAPVTAMRQRMLLAAAVLTASAGLLCWWVLRRQLAPLLATARTLAGLTLSDQPMVPLAIDRPDEIGQLVGSFNRLLEALAQRQVLLQQIFDTSNVALFLVDKQGRITRANQRMARMFDCPLAVLQGSEYLNLVHPSERAAGRQGMLALQTNKSASVDLERRYCRPDGSEFWGHLSARRFIDASGADAGLIGVIADITERYSAEQARQAAEQRFRDLVNSTDGIVWEADAVTFNFTFVSEQAERLLGFPTAHWLQPGFWVSHLHPQDQISAPAICASHTAGLRNHEFEYRFIARDGRTVWLRDIVSVVAEDGQPRWLRGIMIDITAAKQAEASLRIAAIAFESQDAITITDPRHVILKVNAAFTRITGYSAAEVVGRTPALLQSKRHSRDFYRAMWDDIQHHHFWQGEIWNRRKNGEIYPERLVINAVLDENGRVSNYVGIFSDLTQEKKAQDEIVRLAFTDVLTSLPNRRLLTDRLHQAMLTSNRTAQHGALMFLDLDNFKQINDTKGHDLGDLLLQQAATRLQACVREGDSVARMGGDEFVLLLENLSQPALEAATQAEAVASKVLEALSQPYSLRGHAYTNTASIGIVLFLGSEHAVDELLKKADIAMYQAKAAGRNTSRFFDAGMQAAAQARAELEQDLRRGLAQNEFALHYQLQVNRDGAPIGAEALVRWNHASRGLMLPGQFIALAEETGLILPLGQWVLERACGELVQWARQPATAQWTMAVNVSSVQFAQPDFVASVEQALARTGANPQRLKLELTESMLLNDVQEVIAKMSALQARGVNFSLDDFGTGYSSLSYLKRLPLTQLKIDQSFVRDLLTDSGDAVIARTIVALGHSLGLVVIAEGVETQGQYDFLAGIDCDAFQGYYFGRPQGDIAAALKALPGSAYVA